MPAIAKTYTDVLHVFLMRGRLLNMVGFTLRVFAVTALAILPFGAKAQGAVDRLAFIVGNSAYVRGSNNEAIRNSTFNLITPPNDALAYAQALEEMKWEVMNDALVNRSRRALLNDLDEASKRVTQGSEVLFIFNGHGFSNGDTNFLVGVPETGDRFSSVADMEDGSISLDVVVEKLSAGRPSRIILIINACGDEPLVSEASRAPSRPIFDDIESEILVLYSSSPRGIAYDLLDNSEKEPRGDDVLSLGSEAEQAPLLSLFSRNMMPHIADQRPLLSIFTDVRLKVEAQSRFSASDRGLPSLGWRQIPHVVYDTIDGAFSLAPADREQAKGTAVSDWRENPRLCRVEQVYRDEALSLRAAGAMGATPDGDAIRSCILEAALGDLGIASLGFDADGASVIISQTNTASDFRPEDRISMANVTRNGERERFFFQSLDVFRNMLASNYFDPGSKFSFGWRRNDGTLPASGFAQKSF